MGRFWSPFRADSFHTKQTRCCHAPPLIAFFNFFLLRETNGAAEEKKAFQCELSIKLSPSPTPPSSLRSQGFISSPKGEGLLGWGTGITVTGALTPKLIWNYNTFALN
jgi:hypothetical protein